MYLPTISIITLNYNADLSIWRKVLESIQTQDYPKRNIEHLVMDGGSTNGSLRLAKEYGCTIYRLPNLRNNSEGRKGVGMQKSKNDLVAIIEADNILVGTNWLRRMVEPFVKEKNIVGAFSMYNSFTSDMPVLTKYCALIGVNDPTVYYLGKSEKMPRFQTKYNKGVLIKDTERYSVVRFTTNTLPTLGDNGHIVRRLLINKVNNKRNEFLHTDAFYKLAELGYGTYGVVKNSIIHYTGSNIFNLYKRRIRYKNLFFDDKKETRSYYVFNVNNSHDRKKLSLFILYSLTWIQPLCVSIKGFLLVHDFSWFLHPVVCFIAVLSYGISELQILIKKFLQKYLYGT